MTEELKPQITEEVKPAIVGKPPMEYYARLATLDDRSFLGEMKKKNKEPRSSLFAAVALVLMGANAKSNDPYVLDSHSRAKGGFNMQDRHPDKKPEAKK